MQDDEYSKSNTSSLLLSFKITHLKQETKKEVAETLKLSTDSLALKRNKK